MNTHIDRAGALLRLRKSQYAEEELRQALHENPDSGEAHSLLAMSLAYSGQYEEATCEAEQAIACDPDQAFSHFSLAVVYFLRDREEDALCAIEETIRLAPAWDEGFALKGTILIHLSRCQEALEAAEQGLALNPENVECLQTRGIALLELGHGAEAERVVRTALSHDPEDADTHVYLGWIVLHLHGPEAALPHFREALRLDASHKGALAGVDEALRHRSLIYRWSVRSLFWLAGCSALTIRFFILGFIAVAIVIQILIWIRFPHGSKWIGTLFPALYLLTFVICLLHSQLLNLNLRIDRTGKHLLSKRERIEANWIGAYLLLSFPAACLQLRLTAKPEDALVDAFADGFQDWVYYFSFLIPLSVTFRVPQGVPRWLMMLLMTAITIIGYGGLMLAAFISSFDLAKASQLIPVVLAFLSLLVPGSRKEDD